MTSTTSASTTADATAATGGRGPRHANIALAVIAGAQLMVVLDATIVNIALPHIRTGLGFSQTGLSWVLNAYTLTFGGLLLLGGRAGDLFGRRRMFVFGIVLFAVASLLGGFAQDQSWLLATRALQGIGGAVASPTALALIATNFPEGPERNRAFGVYAAVSGAGAAVGLLLGGVLVSGFDSWRPVLFVNVPIGALLVAMTPYAIKESDPIEHKSLDLFGAVSSTLGMAALVYGFIRAATPGDGWGDSVTIISFLLAVVLLAAFVTIESRITEPLLPLRMFSNRTRVGSYIVMLAVGAAVFAMFYFLTQFVQEVLGYSAVKSGFAFLPVSLFIVVFAQISSKLIVRIPSSVMIATGTVFAAGGLLWLSRVTVTTHYSTGVLPAIAILAVGMGLLFVPITLTAVAGVNSEDNGIASAMLNVCQQIGGTIGLSALVTVSSHAASSFAAGHQAVLAAAHCTSAAVFCAPTFTKGADAAFGAGVIFLLVGLVAAVSMLRSNLSEHDLETPVVVA